MRLFLQMYLFLSMLSIPYTAFFLILYYVAFKRFEENIFQKVLAMAASVLGSGLTVFIIIFLDRKNLAFVNYISGRLWLLYLALFIISAAASIKYDQISKKRGLAQVITAAVALMTVLLICFDMRQPLVSLADIGLALLLEKANKRMTMKRAGGFLAVSAGIMLTIQGSPIGLLFIAGGIYEVFRGKGYRRKKYKEYSDSDDEAAKEAGRLGEERVSNELRGLDGYTIIDGQTYGREHIYIRNDSGNYNEIDHIAVGANGVFHIETKSYSGAITIMNNGNWVRVKHNSSEVEELKNPCEQILLHEGVLRGLLGRRYGPALHSIICFGNEHRDNYSIKGEENSQFDIVFHADLKKYLQNCDSETTLSKDEIDEVVRLIKNHMSFEKPVSRSA